MRVDMSVCACRQSCMQSCARLLWRRCTCKMEKTIVLLAGRSERHVVVGWVNGRGTGNLGSDGRWGVDD